MNYNNPLKVIIADNQYLITRSLDIILQEEKQYLVNDVVTTKDDLFNALKYNNLSILILDYKQINFDGFSDLKNIKKEYPCLSILILINSISKTELWELINLGITNIIYKTTGRDEFLSALKATANNKKYFSDHILDMFLELNKKGYVNNENEKQITCSEIEIVRLIVNGHATKEIAKLKNISIHTVMSHRKNIFRKLGVTSISELVIYAIKTGIIETIEYHI